MENTNTMTNISIPLFDHFYLDGKALYIHYFGTMPNISFVNSVDGEKTYKAVREKFQNRIKAIHSYTRYNRGKKQGEFDTSYVVFDNNCIIEFDTNYCMIMHNESVPDFISEVVLVAHSHRERRRRKPLEINIIVRNGNQLEFRSMEIKRSKLDLDLFYEDDFKVTDEIIRRRLGRKKDKGIVLLHGLPGTGKTTYLRYLVSRLRKRVMFLSPDIAGSLVDPEFIQLLINNPDTILIIEDAENIIMDRRSNINSSVSNLLNISDGLLADFLNVQIICTFNSELTMVDSALLRKGRLIAKYEFGKLGIAKAQKLSNHLGFKNVITRPMTVAEIANQHEVDQKTSRMERIGFRV
ncbi:MAG TPA: AAA family ATPase [Chitinophagaceae bacterium]